MPVSQRVLALALAMPVLLSVASQGFAVELPNDPGCREKPAYRLLENIIVLDRTTKLDDASKKRFRYGIGQILSNRSLAGRLVVKEIRDNETQTDRLAEGCLDTLLPLNLAPPTPDGWLRQSVRQVTGFYRAWFPHKDSRREIDLKLVTAIKIATDRKATEVAISNIVDDKKQPSNGTEIGLSLISTLQTLCADRLSCDIFIFSDLLDDVAKQANGSHKDMRAAGRERALFLLRQFAPRIDKTTLSIRAWGFGRRDDNPAKALEEKDAVAYRTYWSGFADAICGNAHPGSTFTISSDFPS